MSQMNSFTIPKGKKGPPLSNYERQEEIGNGTFGKVCAYKRKDMQWFAPHKNVLPKVIAVKTVMNRKTTETKRELEIGLIVSHENIIQILGVSVKKDLIYIKMDLANSDLYKLKNILKIDKFQEDDVRFFSHQIICGLCYLHENLISHRDLKPTNILAFWKSTGTFKKSQFSSITLKLSDFGLSRFVSVETTTASTVGTREYMAPEVAKAFSKKEMLHSDYKKADVFSVGVIIFELLHGIRPFTEIQLLTMEEAAIQSTAEKDEYVMYHLKELLKWSSEARCDVAFAKNSFKPKATSAELEKLSGIEGMKPLHKAAVDGDLAETMWLIYSGDDVNRMDDEGRTPLHYACQSGHLSIVQMLVERGADVSGTPKWLTPFQVACQRGHRSVAQWLIDNGDEDVNRPDQYGIMTPLHRACKYGNTLITKFLFENEADANRANSLKWTPLHYACENDHLSTAQLLIEMGADVNKADINGNTPLHLVCSQGHISVCKVLIENGADVNSSTKYSSTPLHKGCGHGHFLIVQELIERAADVNKTDSLGKTPLHWACMINYLDVAVLLLENGAIKNIKDKNGKIPLDDAHNKKEEFVKLFSKF